MLSHRYHNRVKLKSLNFIDLFCGCGGFSYGMEMAGHKCLLGVDFEEKAIATFQRNHPTAKGLFMDISRLNKRLLSKHIDIESVDMVIGGPPCQGFSTVGKGDVDDKRNQLFKEFVRVTKICNPKVIILENVTGLLAQKNEKHLKQIFRYFEKLGFNMSAQVMSADEYGVASRRRRAILIGVKGITHDELYPSKSHVKHKVVVEQAFKEMSIRYNHEPQSANVKNALDLKRLKRIPAGAGIRYEKDEKNYLPKSLRFDVDWSQLKENRFRQTRLQRLPLDNVAPTILTSRVMYYHPVEHRYLTCREAATLQSFPGEFEFLGSQTSIFRQIGNAVPPLLAYSIGKNLSTCTLKPHRGRRKAQTLQALRSKAFSYHESATA